MSIDDRLSFGEGPLGGTSPEGQPEQPEPGRRPNRAFIFLAIAMGGLILLGILALVGALGIWLPRQKATQIARVTQTVAAMTMQAAAWTPTVMPSPTTYAVVNLTIWRMRKFLRHASSASSMSWASSDQVRSVGPPRGQKGALTVSGSSPPQWWPVSSTGLLMASCSAGVNR